MNSLLRLAVLIVIAAATVAGAETEEAIVRRSAAAAISLLLKPGGPDHLVQPADASGRMWTQLDGLRIGDIAPQPVSTDGQETGIAARYLVAVEVSRHRNPHMRLRRWGEWKDGPPPGFPSIVAVTLRDGSWQTDAAALDRFKRVRADADPSIVPQAGTPALPHGTRPASPQAAAPAAAAKPASGSRKTLIGLVVIGGFVIVALVTGRILANRGILRSPRPMANGGASIRRRLHLLDPSEQHFFRALEDVVRPGRVVSTKVRLAALFEPVPGPGSQDAALPLANRHADFVLTDAATSRILAIVQLVDPADTRPATARRHEFIRSLCALHQVPHFEIPISADYTTALAKLAAAI